MSLVYPLTLSKPPSTVAITGFSKMAAWPYPFPAFCHPQAPLLKGILSAWHSRLSVIWPQLASPASSLATLLSLALPPHPSRLNHWKFPERGLHAYLQLFCVLFTQLGDLFPACINPGRLLRFSFEVIFFTKLFQTREAFYNCKLGVSSFVPIRRAASMMIVIVLVVVILNEVSTI